MPYDRHRRRSRRSLRSGGHGPFTSLDTAVAALSYAWDAQMVSPGVYGTHGSNRPGAST